MMNLRTFPFRAALAFAAALGSGHAAHADDDLRGLRVPLLPKYRQECASCHVAYPRACCPPTRGSG